jgi:hypothetical protein
MFWIFYLQRIDRSQGDTGGKAAKIRPSRKGFMHKNILLMKMENIFVVFHDSSESRPPSKMPMEVGDQ